MRKLSSGIVAMIIIISLLPDISFADFSWEARAKEGMIRNDNAYAPTVKIENGFVLDNLIKVTENK